MIYVTVKYMYNDMVCTMIWYIHIYRYDVWIYLDINIYIYMNNGIYILIYDDRIYIYIQWYDIKIHNDMIYVYTYIYIHIQWYGVYIYIYINIVILYMYIYMTWYDIHND